MKLERMEETRHARAELYDTLGQLSERLNYAKRFDDAVDAEIAKVKRFKKQRPEIFVAAVVGISAVAGAATWLIARSVIRRFK